MDKRCWLSVWSRSYDEAMNSSCMHTHLYICQTSTWLLWPVTMLNAPVIHPTGPCREGGITATDGLKRSAQLVRSLKHSLRGLFLLLLFLTTLYLTNSWSGWVDSSIFWRVRRVAFLASEWVVLFAYTGEIRQDDILPPHIYYQFCHSFVSLIFILLLIADTVEIPIALLYGLAIAWQTLR